MQRLAGLAASQVGHVQRLAGLAAGSVRSRPQALASSASQRRHQRRPLILGRLAPAALELKVRTQVFDPLLGGANPVVRMAVELCQLAAGRRLFGTSHRHLGLQLLGQRLRCRQLLAGRLELPPEVAGLGSSRLSVICHPGPDVVARQVFGCVAATAGSWAVPRRGAPSRAGPRRASPGLTSLGCDRPDRTGLGVDDLGLTSLGLTSLGFDCPGWTGPGWSGPGWSGPTALSCRTSLLHGP